MYLLIDIGNSTIVVATADEAGNITHDWRFKTDKSAEAEHFTSNISGGAEECGVVLADVSHVVISSVVPEVNEPVSQAVMALTGVTPHFFSVDDAYELMPIDVECPERTGKDRIADALGALRTYGAPLLVFDMGTATTVGVVGKDGHFAGGMIIPGVKTSLRALIGNTSLLPVVDVVSTDVVVGKNTVDCMQSGILYGSAAMIDGLIDRMSDECGYDMKVVATGGMSRMIAPYCKHEIIIDPFLQLKGLLSILKK